MIAVYALKPLEWVPHPVDAGCFSCNTVLGPYGVTTDDETGAVHWRFCFDEYYDEGSYECATVEEGKRLAEAHYSERISPALEAV